MTATVQTAVYQMGLDGSGYEQAAQRVDQANRKLLASTEGVAVAEEKVNKATRTTADGFARLEARIDPLARIELRRNQELQRAARYLEEGRVTQDRYAAYVSRLTTHYDEQTAALRRFGGANDNARVGMGRFGGMMQQVGYQVGDFAVQVASGQGVLRPLIQQGTQVVSAFGPWGAVLGAAGAVVGALATTFVGLGKETDKATEAAETYEKVLESLQSVIDEIDGKGKTRIEKLREEVHEQKQIVRAEIAKTQALIDQAKVRAELAQISDPETAFGVGNAEQARIKGLQAIVDEAQKRVDALDEKYTAAANSIYNEEQVEKTKKAVEDLTRAEQKRLEIIKQYDLDRVIQQDKDRAAAQDRGRKIIESDIQAAQKAEADLARQREQDLQKYQRDVERMISHTSDRLVDFAGDSLFRALTGQAMSFWETFKDYGLRMISQLAAEMAIRPLATALTADVEGDEPVQGVFR